MRLRPVKGAAQKIAEHPEYILNIDRTDHYVLNNAFRDTLPLHVEIGSGKGRFIHTMAKRHPNINFLAIEKFDYAVVKILDKVLVEPLKNLYLVRMDAEQLEKCITPGSADKIYLNFSDPWPKARHEKRRLTHSSFLSSYRKILKPNGIIELKTDNRPFFEYSILSILEYDMNILSLSLDLHDDLDSENVMTEFEEKYGKDGPIYKITATFKEA